MATSSKALPALSSVRAWAALAWAVAFWVSVGPVAPGADLGHDADDPQVALLELGPLVDQALVDLGLVDADPERLGQLGLEGGVDQPFEGRGRETLALLLEDGHPGVVLCLADPTKLELIADLRLGLVEPERIDQRGVPVGILGDRLTVDGGDLGEVLAGVGRDQGADQGDDPDEEDQAEGQIDVQALAVVRVATGASGSLGDRWGASGHSDVASCRWCRRSPAGWARYRTLSSGPDRKIDDSPKAAVTSGPRTRD